MRRLAYAVLIAVLILLNVVGRHAQAARAQRGAPAVSAKKHCHYVTKRVHGKKKKVKVCTQVVPPTPTPAPSPTPNPFSWPVGLPSDVVVDSTGDVYFDDKCEGDVVKLDSNGRFLGYLDQTANGTPNELSSPTGITIDSAGHIWVADHGNTDVAWGTPKVVEFSATGTVLGGLDPALPGSAIPNGVAVDGQGYVYVTDTSNNRVLKFSPTGQLVTGWGSMGTGSGQFNLPTGIAIGPDGHVYVADSLNDRIEIFSPSGTYLSSLGGYGQAPGQFYYPAGLAFDARGDLFVAERLNNRIQELSPSGAPLGQWGAFGHDPGQFDGPTGVAVDAAGTIYVADTDNERVQKLSPDGQVLAIWPNPAGGTSAALRSSARTPYARSHKGLCPI